MKIRIEQLNPTVGEIDGNVDLILQALHRAEGAGADLLILPEMVLTGYPVQDLLASREFCENCFRANTRIMEQTSGTALLFGTITGNRSRNGRILFNTALLCRAGEFVGQVHKTLLPVYDIFDELRYFEPNSRFDCLELDGVRLGVTICEDIWYNENETGDRIYRIDPATELKAAGAEAIVNISASPYTKIKHENRLRVLRRRAADLALPLFYCNQIGGQADVLFDGDSLVLSAEGEVVASAPPFRAGHLDLLWQPKDRRVTAGGTSFENREDSAYPEEPDRRLMEAMLTGIRDYLGKTQVSDRVILGLSGGIDSALVAVLAAEAIGPDRVTALTMPSEFSSPESVTDSEQLAANLGITLTNLPIHELFDAALYTLAPLFGENGFGVAEENLQSRIRGMLLMACSNRFGQLLLSTGNKSELAVGYATLYGDMNGALNPIGDLYKTEVFRLCEWLNSHYFGRDVIPKRILEKPPSAELRPGQKDSDSLPPYEVLDDILYRYIELQQEVSLIASEGGHDADLVGEILRLTDLNEFKRFQAPPILKLSSKSFGSGRRWPLVQGWTRSRK